MAVLAAGVVAMGSSGCAALSGLASTSPQPTVASTEAPPATIESPSASADPTGTPTLPPTEAPTLPPTAPPTLAPDEQLAASDLFWERWVRFLPPPTLDYIFDSLEEAVEGSDIIVTGHVVDVYVGEEWFFNEVELPVPLAYARVAVSEVLMGEPLSRQPGTVEVLLLPIGDESEIGAVPYPTEDAIWFLKSRAKEREDLGRPPVSSDIAPYAYFRPNTHQAVIRNIDEVAWPTFPEQIEATYGDDAYPLGLSGMSYDEVVAEVRAAAAENR